MNSKAKEPLFHIVKRDALPWQRGLRIRLLAILLALVVCGILTTIFTGINPVQVYVSIFMGAFGTARKTWITFQNVAILLLISLALTPAFRMRFWNIGGEGQVLIGGLAAAACMICLAGKLPNALVILLMIVTSLAAGAIWGLIPAFFKAKWNTNETLSTLMMNYIATQLVAFFTIVWEMPKGSGKIGIINQKTNIGWLPNLFGSKYLLTIIIAVVMMVLLYVYNLEVCPFCTHLQYRRNAKCPLGSDGTGTSLHFHRLSLWGTGNVDSKWRERFIDSGRRGSRTGKCNGKNSHG